MKKKETGFSFIELLVVITVMAVIMAVGAVTYSDTLKRSRDARREADLQTIRSALEICRANTGVYPAFANVYPSVTCGSPLVTVLAATPKDPKFPYAQYTYTRPTTTTYTLTCTFESGAACSYAQP